MHTSQLKIAVQMDPLEKINIHGDSTFALMLEAQRRGYALFVYHPHTLSLQQKPQKSEVYAKMRPVRVQRIEGAHAIFEEEARYNLSDMDVILMRQDPPFDMGYITATHILEHIHGTGQGKALVVNDPISVRNAPEKLLVTHFPHLMPPTLVTWDKKEIAEFRYEHQDIILKPLYGNGGAGIFRVKPDDENFSSLLEIHFSHSSEPLMVQRYEPAVRLGDKRIILADGKAIGAINRIPAQGDARSNMHVGGRAESVALTKRDHEICDAIGPYLKEHGLIFTGIDVIGNWLTEINVTSPTGLQELDRFNTINSASIIWDSIENRLN